MEAINGQEDAPFTFSGRIRSIKHALSGIELMLRTQHNASVHLVASLAAILMAIYLRISAGEWALIIAAMVAVWVAEAMNTAFELLCDVSSPQFHPIVKQAKDVSAGAVLISAVGAVAIGCSVFIPRIIQIVKG